MVAGLEVEASGLDAAWVRVRDSADLTSGGVLVSRQGFSAFVAGALAGEVRPVERQGLALVEVGDLAERSRWLVTTYESWMAFLVRAQRGDFDEFALPRRM
ncbi:hypothetical protein DP939_41215 [Spongiactinospora rosea]|uniref:Uncharacterized protein n=1 Tax=Spongiactinospora rosea TaxID=2248750 RepID=A0A366LKD8_9ACTN|nr:DUF397 domain-containing protein [Spongiactinospora rosea]RBQ14378.1 hypothetical protein DP939_41215 [Spongiactinospora rosea]